jgi:hypothetical protein
MSTIYKYVTADRVDVLEFGRIRFTQAAALNDPFDVCPCLDDVRDALRERAHRTAARVRERFDRVQNVAGVMAIPLLVKRLSKKFQATLREDYPLLSLTKQRNNLLMWAHYTDCHRGFVIGFDRDHPFFNHELPHPLTPAAEVRYEDERFVVPGKLVAESIEKEEFESEEFERVIRSILLSKSTHWSYEEELRMFAKKNEAVDTSYKDNHKHRVLLYELPLECIKEVIFGHQMDPGRRHRAVEIIKNQLPRAEVFEAKLSPRVFDLDIRPMK